MRDGDQYYWAAFLELLSERPQPRSPIPWSKIIAYAQYTNCGDPDTLLAIIRRLDNYLIKATEPQTSQ